MCDVISDVCRFLNQKHRRYSELNRRYYQAILNYHYNYIPSQIFPLERTVIWNRIKTEMKAERRAKLGQLLVEKGPEGLTERQMKKLQENPEELQNLVNKWSLLNSA